MRKNKCLHSALHIFTLFASLSLMILIMESTSNNIISAKNDRKHQIREIEGKGKEETHDTEMEQNGEL